MADELNEEMRKLGVLLLRNRGKLLGAFLGLLAGWLTIRLGVWRAIFIAMCLAAGYYLGSRVDAREDLGKLFTRFWPPRER